MYFILYFNIIFLYYLFILSFYIIIFLYYIMFTCKFTTKDVEIKHSGGITNKGFVNFSISKNSFSVYISRDNNRIYWIGRTKGISAKLKIKFNDKKSMITINTSNKITFYNEKDYEKIKNKTIYYKHMDKDDDTVIFEFN